MVPPALWHGSCLPGYLVKRMMKIRHKSNNKGFSLIEMIWVVLVFGIILVIAAPSFVSFLNSSRLVGISNELMGDIHWTRSRAVSKRRTHQIVFTAGDYQVIETATAQIVRTRTLPAGVSFVTTGDPNFFAWGLADPTTITINGQGASTRNLGLAANGNVQHY